MLLERFVNTVWILILVGALWYLASQGSQGDFISIIVPFAMASVAYIRLCLRKLSLTFIIGAGLALRLLIVPYFPTLSDDIYRFIWDGLLILQGDNPYLSIPVDISTHQDAEYFKTLLPLLNSPEYFTIYPPVSQALFALGAAPFPTSISATSIVYKLFLVGFDMGSLFYIIKMLKSWDLSIQRLSLYALNPLVIIEGIGNLHFEIAMLFFLMAALYFLFEKEKIGIGALLFALSVATKLTTVLLLPLLLLFVPNKKWMQFLVWFSLVSGVLFIPIYSAIPQYLTSIDLFFRSFEFNASVYYVFRSIGYALYGYNKIALVGPMLKILFLCIYAFYWIKIYHKKDRLLEVFFNASVFLLLVFYFLATTVHPWYIILILPLAVFSEWKTPILWSILVMTSYYAYQFSPVQENHVLNFIVYFLIFGMFFWEYKRIVKPDLWKT